MALRDPLKGFHWMIFQIVLTCLKGQHCYLTAKPVDALRSIGQSVTFTCNSSWTEPVRWWSRPNCDPNRNTPCDDDILLNTDPSNHTHVTGELGAGSQDGYRSTLTINNITKNDDGIYRCQDGTGSRGFARLTVTNSPEVVCLPVSPRDKVVIAGEDIVFTALEPSARIRWFYVSPGESNAKSKQLYNGVELNDLVVNERFSLMGVGDKGHADLVLRSVQPKDAGRYVAKNIREESVEITANLVVFVQRPECKHVWDLSVTSLTIHCQASYKGEMTPRLTFLGRNVSGECLQKNSTEGTIECSLWADLKDLEETVSQYFEINYQRKRCGEFAGNWVWQYAISADDIDTLRWKRIFMVVNVTVLVVSALILIISTMCCVMSYRKRQHSTGKSSKGENEIFVDISDNSTEKKHADSEMKYIIKCIIEAFSC